MNLSTLRSKNLFFSISRWNEVRKDVRVERNGQKIKFFVGNDFSLDAQKYPYICLDSMQFTLKVAFGMSEERPTPQGVKTVEKNRLRAGFTFLCSNLCEMEESYGMEDKHRMLSQFATDNSQTWNGNKIYGGSPYVSDYPSPQYRHWFKTNNQFSGQNVWFSLLDAELQPLLLSRSHTIARGQYGIVKYSFMYKIRVTLSSLPVWVFTVLLSSRLWINWLQIVKMAANIVTDPVQKRLNAEMADQIVDLGLFSSEYPISTLRVSYFWSTINVNCSL